MATEPTTILGVKLVGELCTRFDDYRWSHRMSVSEIVRAAIAEYLDRREAERPASEGEVRA